MCYNDQPNEPKPLPKLTPISPEAPLSQGAAMELVKAMITIGVLRGLHDPSKYNPEEVDLAIETFANSPTPGMPTMHRDLELGLRYILTSLKQHFGE